MARWWRRLRDNWQYVAAIVAAGWTAFIYFDGRDVSQPKQGQVAESATPAKALPDSPASAAATPNPAPSTPATVIATGGIAVGGNVIDSELQVDAETK